MAEFIEFPKMARYSREVIVTEKIDGTNAQVCIVEEDGVPDSSEATYRKDGLALYAGSRTRWIQPNTDNHGFAMWCLMHGEELLQLGPGRHFGEWWGNGIQRGYGLSNGDKRFSLFNVTRWCLHGNTPMPIQCADPRVVKMQDVLPACVGLVPVLWSGPMDHMAVDDIMIRLQRHGSVAAPEFMEPEGIVIFHTAGNVGFKKTFKNDEGGKRRGA